MHRLHTKTATAAAYLAIPVHEVGQVVWDIVAEDTALDEAASPFADEKLAQVPVDQPFVCIVNHFTRYCARLRKIIECNNGHQTLVLVGTTRRPRTAL